MKRRRILFAAAEQQEIDCAKQAYNLYKTRLADNVDVDFMLTGIGVSSTCYRLTKKILESEFEQNPYSLVVDLGIAGSYNLKKFPEGSVAVISKEYFGDLGFETPFGFETLFQNQVLDADLFPFKGGAVHLEPFKDEKLAKLLDKYEKGVGVTVQTITGSKQKAEELCNKFTPDIESMEGAAVYYVCLQEGVPFVEIRTVSNAVGESDSSKWQTSLALNSLLQVCKEILDIYC